MQNEINNNNLKCDGFKEGKVDFLPTYKYTDDETNEIICDCIDHIPSWTDRILYMINDTKFHFIDDEESDNFKKEENLSDNDFLGDIYFKSIYLKNQFALFVYFSRDYYLKFDLFK